MLGVSMSSIGGNDSPSPHSPETSYSDFPSIVDTPSSSRSLIISSPAQTPPPPASTSLSSIESTGSSSRLAPHSSSSPPSITIPSPSPHLLEWNYPPLPANSIAFIVNGDLEFSDLELTAVQVRTHLDRLDMNPLLQLLIPLRDSDRQLATLINSFIQRVLVDGGAHYARLLEIKPTFAVGDFDSMSPTTGDYFGQELHKRAIILIHDKDQTDLEAAINLMIDESRFTKISESNRKKLRKIAEQMYQMVVFGGLGGRIDHALGNIFLLLRHPGRLFFYTENQWIFALEKNENLPEPITISTDGYHSLGLLPLYGKATVAFSNESGPPDIHTVESQPFAKALNGKTTLSLTVTEGIVVFCLDKTPTTSPPTDILPPAPFLFRESTSFSVRRPFVQIYRDLAGLFTPNSSPLYERDAEGKLLRTVHLITPALPLIKEVSNRNIISLIPFGGRADGVVTEGLQWALPSENWTGFSKEFLGISNYATQTTIKVRLAAGFLLAIINHKEFEPEPNAVEVQEKKEGKENDENSSSQSSSPQTFRRNLREIFDRDGLTTPQKRKPNEPRKENINEK
jgi:thiamine pyrophosphokinase